MLITFREVIDTRAHVGDYTKSKFLRVLALAMMLAREGYETFGKADKSDAECALIDDALDGIGRSEILGTIPQTRHEQRELLGHSGLLEVESLAQLTGCNLKDVIKFAEDRATRSSRSTMFMHSMARRTILIVVKLMLPLVLSRSFRQNGFQRLVYGIPLSQLHICNARGHWHPTCRDD